nr:hypothetical protein [uncultured Dyadobacter sp.]
MEGVKLADWFFVAGGVTGLVLMLTFYRVWSSRQPFTKAKVTLFRVLGGFMAFFLVMAGYLQSTNYVTETGAETASPKADPVKSKYLGLWKAPRGKASIEIYEENGGLFAKFWQGDIMPLKFQQDGQYYEGATALGAMPLIIRNDTLQYSQSKYIRTQD